jgi:hypothetical protein
MQKPLLGSEYAMTYFVLHFIHGAWQIISQLVCNESNNFGIRRRCLRRRLLLLTTSVQ